MIRKKKPSDSPVELDHLDFSILSYLKKDSKTPLKRIASELGIHPNTLIQRIKKMEGSGVVKKYSADVDFPTTGLDLHIIVMIKVKRGRAGLDQLKELVKIKEVEALYAATGLWDAIGFVRVRNRKHLLEVVERIGDHPIVLKTSSSIILKTYKDPNDYNPFG